jgi:hypothetical protein
MFRRLGLAFTAAMALVLLIALPAAAGGWASASIQEGTPTEDGGSSVGITLLQHGETPVSWGEVGMTAVNAETGERLTFSGTPRLSDAQWTTWFELPAGSWSLTVTHPDLAVSGSEGELSITIGEPSAVATTGASGASLSPALGLGLGVVLLLTLAAAASYLMLRRRAAGMPAGRLIEG